MPLTTQVWISAAARKVLEKFATKDKVGAARWGKQLRRCAESGFELWIGDQSLVRHKWNRVFAFQTGILLRVVGFFPNGNYREFVIIDAYWKSGQRMDATDRERVDRVSQVRSSGGWQRSTTP